MVAGEGDRHRVGKHSQTTTVAPETVGAGAVVDAHEAEGDVT